jgi:hypothetical protein
MSVGAIVERTLVTHLEGHVEQLRRLPGKESRSSTLRAP